MTLDGTRTHAIQVARRRRRTLWLGRGLGVALEHRGAEWRDGDWVPAPELWDQ